MNRNISQTSLQAYRSVRDDGTISAQKAKILAALEIMGSGNAYGISLKCGMRKEQVGRRLIDLVRDKKIYDTGKSEPSDTGRASVVYSLIKAAIQ